jgi:hypothetical protein
MAPRLTWTDAMDNRLRQERAATGSWGVAAEALGISRWAVIERAKALGIWEPSPFRQKESTIIARMVSRSNSRVMPPPVRLAYTSKPIPRPPCCQWPLNDARPWLFCEGALAESGPYCDEHRAMAREQPRAAE